MKDEDKTRIFRGAKRHKIKQLIHELLHGEPSKRLLTTRESEPLMHKFTCPCGAFFHLMLDVDYRILG